MRLASWRTWTGWTVAMSLGFAGAVAAAAQNVPDAPKPQTLPRLNTITPAAPAIPNAPTPNAPTPTQPADTVNGGVVPGSTLPPSTAPGQTAPDATDAGDTGPLPASHEGALRVRVNLVQIPFTVKDSKGSLVPGITYRDVQVYENGLRQRIALFQTDPIPLSVALVIDQSVTFDNMRKINASLSALQASFAPYDEVSIFTYNNGVKQQTGFTGAQSARVTYALEQSKAPGREANMAMGGPLACTTCKNNLPVDPNTNPNSPAGVILQTPEREYHTLNDAILTAAETVAHAGQGRRRIIYVISDGKEYGSQAKAKEVIRFLQTNQISVFATLVGESAVPGTEFLNRIHLPLQMRDDVLPRYTTATGGDFDAAFRPRGIQASFAKLAEQVRLQYTVGYYSHEDFIDGKFRPVDVRVLRPSLTVLAKPGYYPTAQTSGPRAAATAAPTAPTSPSAATPVGTPQP